MWEQLARTSAGTLIAYKLATGGLKRGSLQRDGAAAAFVVGLLSFSCSIRCGVTLLFFYKSGSMLTRVGADVKRKVEEGYAAEGQRGAAQVLACSAVGVAAAVLRRALVGPDAPLDFSDLASAGNRLTLAYVSFFACCAGDTWASELGVLSASPPRIITQPWRTAPAGTNGGVSVLGTLASAAGGACIGACHAACLLPPSGREALGLVWAGLVGGVGGSLLDSLLGATVQATYYDEASRMVVGRPTPKARRVAGLPLLSNEMVNFVSTAAAAVAAASAPRLLLGWLAPA
mmetsp:Transcript_27474/g.89683  ORF Transcript_27474/g.89683 Transcript_27474/m.89683 type:complete len:289 (-) Transcript_27474:125-991(-)